ncbi:LysM peptidoglycan-binding domain-containing protein [Paenibacillus aurantiacus]|uniref:LysM peptidoglycan-binding domain-containing protein n=1 Tax=Paenibacillus aurantiacus TaxID=1936118 RepID=A0ABV5KPV6_9BACL
MSNQTNGLRFDVYERVHLPDDVLGIDELEEIELVPRIQVIRQGEQVLLKGHLLLSGVYRSSNGRADAQSLEHWIPVEITLPLNRVSRLDDISVEIDNFDVDLLSARTLNITGVLSLLGIELEPANQAESWREEPYTVVHERSLHEDGEAGQAEPALDNRYYDNWAASEQAEQFKVAEAREIAEREAREAALRAAAEEEAREAERAQERQHELWRQQEAIIAQQREREEEETREAIAQIEREAAEQREREEQETREAIAQIEREAAEQREREAQQAEREAREEREREEAARAEIELAQTSGQDEQLEADLNRPAETVFTPFLSEEVAQAEDQRAEAQESGEQPVEEVARAVEDADQSRKEPRVAVNAKPLQDSPEQPERASGVGIGFRSILHSSQREQEARAAAELSAKRAAEEARRASADEIEWKSLFLNRTSEQNAFRKVRMAIVQREDTLDSIADRYQLQAREIALYNRLNDQSVTEGQVLYIP